MSDRTGEVVDFSEAPEASTFGLNADGGYVNGDPVGQLEAVRDEVTPGWSHYLKLKAAYTETVNPPEQYFHGAWWEELFLVARNITDAGSQIVEVFDLGKSVGTALAGDWFDALGAIAGVVVKGQLVFLMNSIQPIQDLAGVLMGNEAKVDNSAAMWKAVSENLTSLKEAIEPELRSTLTDHWGGQAGVSAAVRSADLVDTVTYAADSSMHLSDMLAIYADLAKRVNGLVVEIIADVVAALVSAAGDIATKGWFAVIPIGIDLSILLTNYCLKLTGIAIQVAWFIFSGTMLAESLRACFDHAMTVLRELAGYASA